MSGILGLVIVGVTFAIWFRLMQQVAIPRNRLPFEIAIVIGVVAGLVGVFGSGGWLGSLTGGLAAFAGSIFLLLRLQSGQKSNDPAVAVGGPILAFSAPDASGEDFDLAKLSGKPYLLKFFRGHW